MDKAKDLLKAWGYPTSLKNLKGTTIQALSALTPKDVKDLIPQIANRALFMRCWRTGKSEFTSVGNISLSLHIDFEAAYGEQKDNLYFYFPMPKIKILEQLQKKNGNLQLK